MIKTKLNLLTIFLISLIIIVPQLTIGIAIEIPGEDPHWSDYQTYIDSATDSDGSHSATIHSKIEYRCYWLYNDWEEFWYVKSYHIRTIGWKLVESTDETTSLDWFYIYDQNGNIVWSKGSISNPVSDLWYQYSVSVSVTKRNGYNQFGAHGTALYKWKVDSYWVGGWVWETFTAMPYVHNSLPNFW